VNVLTFAEPRLSADTLVSVVIPCFNEEAVLPLLFERFQKAADDWPHRLEVVLIDDGSSDRTWSLLEEFHHLDPRWKILRLSRNFGHQLALWTGLQHTTGDVIAVLDADLQDPPEILPRLLEKWADGYDVVFAVRTERKEGLFKRSAYYLYYRLLRLLSDIDIPLDSGDFCAMDRRVVEALRQCPEQEPFIRGLRAWVGFRQTSLVYARSERAAGEVKYTFRKLMQLGLNGIFSFSTKPLRLVTGMGLLMSMTAFLGALFYLLQRIFVDTFAKFGFGPVPGFATIVIAILFFSGVQLIGLGIIGEYVGRIFREVKRRPLTLVADARGIRKKRRRVRSRSGEPSRTKGCAPGR
jgi:glycosyltransferase involved in cell wall biosynthesis